MRNILWTAKNELKANIQNGKVLIRKDDPNDNKIKSIRTLSDISTYAVNK